MSCPARCESSRHQPGIKTRDRVTLENEPPRHRTASPPDRRESWSATDSLPGTCIRIEETSMKFGFCIMSDIDEIGFFSFIENLGYDSAWVADSQMMYSDLYAVCALAAQQTKTTAHRSRHGDLRHPHPAGAGRGDGNAEPHGAGPGVPGHRHRQHRDAHHGPEADEDRRVQRISARHRRPARRRGGGLCLRGHAPAR